MECTILHKKSTKIDLPTTYSSGDTFDNTDCLKACEQYMENLLSTTKSLSRYCDQPPIQKTCLQKVRTLADLNTALLGITSTLDDIQNRLQIQKPLNEGDIHNKNISGSEGYIMIPKTMPPPPSILNKPKTYIDAEVSCIDFEAENNLNLSKILISSYSQTHTNQCDAFTMPSYLPSHIPLSKRSLQLKYNSNNPNNSESQDNLKTSHKEINNKNLAS